MSLLDKLIAEDQQRIAQPKAPPAPAVILPPKTPRLVIRGQPRRSDPNYNCLACFNYVVCKDPKKNWNYLCSKFIDNRATGETSATLMHLVEQWQDTLPTKVKILPTDPGNDDSELIVLVNNIINSGLTTAPDFRIDDRDFPLAPNICEFFLNPKWIGKFNEEPYAQQMRIALEFYQEYNPRLTDVEFFETMPVDTKISQLLEHVSLLEYGRCPKTGVRRSELVRNSELNDHYIAALPIGQRAGKTSTFAKMLAYTTHQFIKLSDPAGTFKLASGSWLVCTVTAWSYAQCLLSIWQHLHPLFVSKDNWFGHYNQLLADYSRRYGEQLFNITGRIITYNHRNLLLMPASPNPDTLRGPTRFCLTGDTLVNTDKGLTRLDDYDILGQKAYIGKQDFKIVRWTVLGIKPTTTIITNCGLEITGTSDHEIPVLHNSKINKLPIKDIRTGDILLAQLGGEFPKRPVEFYYKFVRPAKHAFPKHVSNELAYLLGYWVAEGKYTTFTNTSQKIVNHFVQCYKTVFNVVPRVDFLPARDEKHQNAWRVSVAYKIVKDFLRYIGLSPSYSFNKEIPWPIFQSNKKHAQCFLQAFLEGDGSIDKNHGTFRYFSSIKLLKQLQILLLKFEVLTVLSPSSDTVGVLYPASTFDNRKYASHVGYIFKQQDMIQTRRLRRGSATITFYAVPHLECLDTRLYGDSILEQAWLDNGLDKPDEYKNKYIHAWKRCEKNNTVAYNNLFNLRDKGYAFLRVTEKYNNLKQNVYDITVAGNPHLFSANGIIVSNCAAVDELGRFRIAKGESAEKSSGGAAKFNGRETYISLEASLQTLQGMHHTLRMQGDDNIPVPPFFNFGSPSSQLDELMRLYKLSQNNRNIFGLKLATWEVNPHLPRSYFNQHFAENPLHAQSNYGADPPMSSAAFIEDIKYLKASVDMQRENAVTLNIKRVRTPSGRLYMSGTPVFYSRDKSVAKLMSLDAGFNRNSFSMAIGHNSIDLSSIIVDAIIELIPQENLPINHSYVFEDIIIPIIRELNITMIISDRWESLKGMHDLERLNIKAERYSLKYMDFNNFRESIFNGEIKTPRPEIQSRDPQEIIRIGQDNYPFGFNNKPCAHYLYQCVTVRDFVNQTVLKGELTGDDNFRAIVLLHSYLSDPAYQKEFSGTAKARMRGVGTLIRPGDVYNSTTTSKVGSLIRGGTPHNFSSMPGIYTFAVKR